MRVVVVGASGNVGTSLLRSLADEPAVDSVSTELEPLFRGADAVVHLAWLIQPSRDQDLIRAVNVDGSGRVFRAAAAAGVGSLVYASSVGAYSKGPKDRRVDESWPTTGIPTSFYSRHKAEVERVLDRFERENTGIRVVRLRPALVFKREAASEIRRLFAGPLLPGFLLRRDLVPVLPAPARLAFQAVHSYDAGDAYRLAVVGDARGAFNIAAEPVLDPAELGRLLDARPVSLPPQVLRAGAALTYRLRLQPSEVGWVDMGLGVPLMDTTRAREELRWEPRYSATDALRDLFAGMRESAGLDTPPLEPGGAGPGRLREFTSGVGARTR